MLYINAQNLKAKQLHTIKFITDFNARKENAFKSLFNEYYPSLCYYALRFVNDSDQVKDIVQNVFINIWNKAGTDFKNLTVLNAYLYTSVRNACLNFLRQENLHREKHEEIRQEETIVENEFLQEKLENEVMLEIFKAIDELPKACRTVFKYSYLYGMSNNEITDLLGISINTVKTHKMRAKQLLKEQLKNVFHIIIALKMGF